MEAATCALSIRIPAQVNAAHAKRTDYTRAQELELQLLLFL